MSDSVNIVKELISFWKIPPSNNLFHCHTSYCKQCSLYILKVAKVTLQSLLIGNQEIIRHQRKSEIRRKTKEVIVLTMYVLPVTVLYSIVSR